MLPPYNRGNEQRAYRAKLLCACTGRLQQRQQEIQKQDGGRVSVETVEQRRQCTRLDRRASKRKGSQAAGGGSQVREEIQTSEDSGQAQQSSMRGPCPRASRQAGRQKDRWRAKGRRETDRHERGCIDEVWDEAYEVARAGRTEGIGKDSPGTREQTAS